MRTGSRFFSIFIALILLSAAVAQAQTVDLSGNADCDGWSAMATLVFPAGVYSGDLSYSMVLTDQSGTEVTRFDYSGQVYRFEDPVMMKMFGESWGLPLDSIYLAHFVLQFIDQESALEFDVVCGEETAEPNPCRYSPGFWKSNPDLWPVETLAVGGVDLNQSQLVAIMMAPVRGSGSLLMARELIAAKLNVANGCDDSIQSSIDEGDLFLTSHPLEQDLWRNTMHSTRELRQALSVYNKVGCDEFAFDSEDGMADLQFRTAASEETTFGSLKAMYR
jgi:hypothetical protein